MTTIHHTNERHATERHANNQRDIARKTLPRMLLLACAVSLSACGGGGSTGAPSAIAGSGNPGNASLNQTTPTAGGQMSNSQNTEPTTETADTPSTPNTDSSTDNQSGPGAIVGAPVISGSDSGSTPDTATGSQPPIEEITTSDPAETDTSGDSTSAPTPSYPAWSISQVYLGGDRVVHEGDAYEAKWWTQGDNPASGGDASPWLLLGAGEVASETSPSDESSDSSSAPGVSTPIESSNTAESSNDIDTTGWPKALKENNRPYENTSGKVVASYFVEWGVYGRNYHVADIPAENLTHIIYGFVPICGPNDSLQQENPQGYAVLVSQCAGKPDFSVVIHDSYAALEKSYPGDKWDDPIRGNFGQLRRLKASNPDIKILPSIGGWTFSDPFYSLTNNAQNRAVFVASAINFIRTYDFFDGIDIDWEYPGGNGANKSLGSPDDREGYTLLMRDLRNALDQLGLETGREYQLTSAVGLGPSNIDAVDYQTASQYLNYIFGMSYDFYGAWNTTLGHQTGLYASEVETEVGFNADAGINRIIAQGVPSEKLVLGVAMYGRGWSKVSGGQPDYPFSGQGTTSANWAGAAVNKIKGSWEDGVLDYKDIELNHLGGPNGTGINGFNYYYDDVAEAPYLWNYTTGELITFDDARSSKAKGEYAVRHNLGGLLSWEIDADNGTILNAMHEGLGHPQQ